MVKLDHQEILKQEMMASGYCAQRGGVEEAYDAATAVVYYRPFLYGNQPKIKRWSRRFGLIPFWRLSRWFKN
ncbi:MAG: hypothetical protein JW782_02295 [Candidatus Saganbacteria bacterium]|nr:hypothetical protein [Candidatus Saganbacteria bacterium]